MSLSSSEISDLAAHSAKLGPMDRPHVVQMLQHIADLLNVADDPDDYADISRVVHSYLNDLTNGDMSEQEKDLREELGTEGTDVNEPVTKDAGMSEQEQELRNIFSALKDDPGDSRWE